MKGKSRNQRDTTWTDLRTEIQRVCAGLNLDVKPLNIHEWAAVEYRVISHFTGDRRIGMTWMWENRIRGKFDSYGKEIGTWEELCDALRAVIPADGRYWLFLEDSLRLNTKFWGYSGDMKSIIALLSELPVCDFYIVSKKLRWVAGESHEGILFAYGEIAGALCNHFEPVPPETAIEDQRHGQAILPQGEKQ
jgi:hypothetical protein